MITQSQERNVRVAQLVVQFTPVGKRKTILNTLRASGETDEEAVNAVIDLMRNESTKWKTFIFDDGITVIDAKKLGDILMLPHGRNVPEWNVKMYNIKELLEQNQLVEVL